MRLKAGSEASVREWKESIISDKSLRFAPWAENYLGAPVKGKSREAVLSGIISALDEEAMCDSAVAMMDGFDRLAVAGLLVSGGMDIHGLRGMLRDAWSFSEIEYRLAQLVDRFLVFRRNDGIMKVNPLLAEGLLARLSLAIILFGPDPEVPDNQGKASAEGGQGIPSEIARKNGATLQDAFLALYALLKEEADPTLKSGVLSSRAKKSLERIFKGDTRVAGWVEEIFAALLGAGILAKRDGELQVDFASLMGLLELAPERLAYALLELRATGRDGEILGATGRSGVEGSLGFAGEILRPFMERGFVFSRAGLERFFFLFGKGGAGAAGAGGAAGAFASAMEGLGLVEKAQGGYRCAPERLKGRWSQAGSPGNITIDGTGAIHALEGASAKDVAALCGICSLRSAGEAWEFAATRNSARRAFESGMSPEDVESILVGASSRPLPQAISFDLRSWRRQFDAARLYKGYVAVLDEETSALAEKGLDAGERLMEKIAPGVYFIPATHFERAKARLEDIGIALPKPASAGFDASPLPRVTGMATTLQAAPESGGEEAARLRELLFSPVRSPAPHPAKGFLEILEGSGLGPERRLAVAERIGRRLVYTPEQLRAIVGMEKAASGAAEPEPCAKGLDFQGKLRVISGALKSKYPRLEIKWMRQKAAVVDVLRPTGLRKTASDYELEGEDVATGKPLVIRVGAMLSVCHEKGFHSGE